MNNVKWKLEFDEHGNPYKINPSTGEVRLGAERPIFEGDKIVTPEQQDANKKYIDSLKRAAGRRTASRDLGKYFFIAGGQRFSDLKPQTAARLVYLQTFCDFAEDKGNRLKLNTKQDMRRSDLQKVLGLSYDAANAFWKEVSPNYLTEDDSGLIFSNLDVFIRGKIEPGSSYYRAYVRGVRKLYAETPKSKHRHVGYLFQLLPFVSVEFNAICWNPEEQDVDEIEFLTLDEFCDLIDYDRSRRDRLLSIYRQLTFEVEDKNGTHRERFLSIVGDGLDKGSHRLYVNPRVLYSGSDYKQVAILGRFSED